MAGIKDVIETLDSAIEGFDGAVNASQKEFYKELVALVKQLDTKNGKIKQSIANLKVLTQIKSKMHKLANSDSYIGAVGKFVKYFDKIQEQQNAYFVSTFPESTLGMEAKKKHELMKQMAVQNTIASLTDDGIRTVTDKVNDILLRAVTSGAKYADLTEELRAHMLGKEGGAGALARYATTYATTALSQFTGQNNKLLTQDLGVKWYMYTGSTMETTREFCDCLVKKRYIHRSELKKIVSGEIDGHQCAIYPKTNLPYGMIEGTTEENFQINCGGWNCRHQLVPVHELAVPAEIRAKFAESEPNEKKVEQPTLQPSEQQKAKIDTIKQYIVDHPGSGKVKNYLASAEKAIEDNDTTTLDAILKAAIADIKKFDAAKKSIEKKKAEEAALKEAAANAEQDEKWKTAVEAMTKAHGLIANYKYEGSDALFEAFKKHDLEALKDETLKIYEYKMKMDQLTAIPNLDKWAEDFTYDQLKSVQDYVTGHITFWKNNGKDVIKKLAEEPKYIKFDDAHPTAEVLKDALEKALVDATEEKEWELIKNDLLTVQEYVSSHKSQKTADYLADLADAIKAKDKEKAQQVAKDAIKYIKNQISAKKSAEKKKGKKASKDDLIKVAQLAVLEPDKYNDDYNDIINYNNDVKKKTGKTQAELVEEFFEKAKQDHPEAFDDSKDIKLTEISSENVNKYEKAFKALTIKEGLSWVRSQEPKDLIPYVKDINKKMFPAFEKQWAKLTTREMNVLYGYTISYCYINEPLRGKKYLGSSEKAKRSEKDIEIMTDALKKCKTERDMVVRRGTSDFAIRSLMKNLSELEVGDEWIDGGFLSSSLHPTFGFDYEYTLVIYVPKGAMGIYAEPFSAFGQSRGGEMGNYDGETDVVATYGVGSGHNKEFEWIGQRGAKYKVVKVEDADFGKCGASKTFHMVMIGQLYDQP